jgi:hypothetical protein
MEAETMNDGPSPDARGIPLDRAVVLVRAPLASVLSALASFTRGEPVVDVTTSLEKGVGLDEVLSGHRASRAVLYKLRGSDNVGLIREGVPREVHDVPLARRLSRTLDAPAVALHVAARDVAYELFHGGRSLESWLCLSGDLICAESAFELDPEAVARDPYGRALAVLAGYGFEDDRLSFDDFVRGDLVLRRWDVTLGRCYAFSELAPWPLEELSLVA